MKKLIIVFSVLFLSIGNFANAQYNPCWPPETNLGRVWYWCDECQDLYMRCECDYTGDCYAEWQDLCPDLCQ